jgi:signal transduction histidine kinase
VQPQLEPAPVDGDPGLLDRLLDNLLDNAIRYNVDHGWVRVTIGPDPGAAVLEVASSGTVIPADAADELFTPFRRLDGRTGSQRGMGLGLSIVRAIATPTAA